MHFSPDGHVADGKILGHPFVLCARWQWHMSHLPGMTLAFPLRGACQHNSSCHCTFTQGFQHIPGPAYLRPPNEVWLPLRAGWMDESPCLRTWSLPVRKSQTLICHGGRTAWDHSQSTSSSCRGTQPFLLNLLSFSLNGSNCQLSHGFLDSSVSCSFWVEENGESWAYQPRALEGGLRMHRLCVGLAQTCVPQSELCPPNS